MDTLAPRVTRREDLRLVTGHGRYTADWNLPNQLHAAVLRADRAHAEIVRIDTAAAAARPGVRLVLTGDDMRAAGLKSLPTALNLTGKGGQQLRKPFHPVLAMGRVRYVGEPVAMVIAETAAAAEDARDLIEIDYRDLPAAATVEDALAQGAPQIHDDIPGNIAFEYESGDAQATAAAFARARYVSRLTMESQRLVGNMLEPRACLVAYDSGTDGYTFHVPLQGVAGMKGGLSYVTGIPKEKITIVAQDVGGSFGVRAPPYAEYFAAMVAARKLGRPVKWVATRAETFLSDTHGRALSLTGELAIDADGQFLAIRWDDRADLGAYPASFGPFIATRNLTVTMGGVYRIPAMYAQSRLVYTNAVPVSAYRGAGRPDIAYAVERLVDYAAAEHGFDRIELRRRNMIPRDAMPYKTSNGTTYDSGDFEAVMDDALARADWNGFAARREDAKRRGKLRGIGIATYLEAGGGGAAPKDQVAAEFDGEGKITLHAVTQSSGQGHETVFPQIVAGELGIDTRYIRFSPNPPAADLVGNGTGGSRGVLGTGSAFKVLGQKLIEMARPHAAKRLGVREDDVEYRDGAFTARAAPGSPAGAGMTVAFVDLARELTATNPHPLNTTADGVFGTTYPNGCHIAEVEIDPETGCTMIERYTAVDDLGTVINPTLVEGQVHGGVAQGAGQVFGEHAIYDRATGQLLTGTFSDYYMPRAGLLRNFEVHDHPVPTAVNALGAKGVGEAGCSGSVPALSNAAIDALAAVGVKHLDMPLTPAKIWEAIRRSAASRSSA